MNLTSALETSTGNHAYMSVARRDTNRKIAMIAVKRTSSMLSRSNRFSRFVGWLNIDGKSLYHEAKTLREIKEFMREHDVDVDADDWSPV